MGLTRRGFLKGAATGGAMFALPRLARAQSAGSAYSVAVLGDRTIGDQDGKKVASWSARPQGVKFVCGDEGRNCMFAAEADGLYIYKGFSVFLY